MDWKELKRFSVKHFSELDLFFFFSGAQEETPSLIQLSSYLAYSIHSGSSALTDQYVVLEILGPTEVTRRNQAKYNTLKGLYWPSLSPVQWKQ